LARPSLYVEILPDNSSMAMCHVDVVDVNNCASTSVCGWEKNLVEGEHTRMNGWTHT